ncbi:hypothetical protein SISNIDRAFT_491642 [Sistotremastrum niveocremeum HHB9708]|uniref:Uncharacterized protein n=1 Tax=Sistotremastrum niveocremeum HHB9708 TaxID=1314777 RepID=A0A164MKD2_9AGAM|nr:hypothetical protein SISNIDRAFT_491642 [Sistotremastrum niveocremeum HHB9708]
MGPKRPSDKPLTTRSAARKDIEVVKTGNKVSQSKLKLPKKAAAKAAATTSSKKRKAEAIAVDTDDDEAAKPGETEAQRMARLEQRELVRDGDADEEGDDESEAANIEEEPEVVPAAKKPTARKRQKKSVKATPAESSEEHSDAEKIVYTIPDVRVPKSESTRDLLTIYTRTLFVNFERTTNTGEVVLEQAKGRWCMPCRSVLYIAVQEDIAY